MQNGDKLELGEFWRAIMASFINTVIERNAVTLGQQIGPNVWKVYVRRNGK